MPTATAQPAGRAPVDIAVLVPMAERHGLRPGMSRGRLADLARRSCRWDPRRHGWGSYHTRMHAYAWIALHGLWYAHHLAPARSCRPDAVVYVDEPWLVFTDGLVARYETLAAAFEAIDSGEHEWMVRRYAGHRSRVDLMSRAYHGGLPGLGRHR